MDFLWKGWNEKDGYHLVAWESVCKPKNECGVGIQKIRMVDEALLTKWLVVWGRGKQFCGGKPF